MTAQFNRLLRGLAGNAAIIAAMIAAMGATAARASNTQDAQDLVDRATLALNEVMNDDDGGQAHALLPRARAVMICPRVFRAGFLFGGEGGGCVLTARAAGGSWSSPAFYSMGGGSFGFQAGIQDAQIVLMILTPGGLRAVMDDQFRLGANASVAFVTVGGGVEGATTAALNADIVAYARTRGLFAGISLQGTVMASDSGYNFAYYGQPVGPIDIVSAMRVNNPAADPLRAALMRLSAPVPAAPPPPMMPPPQAMEPPPPVTAQGYAAAPSSVQQESLPPPR